MKKVLKALTTIVVLILFISVIVFLFVKNKQLNEAYVQASQQISSLQSKLDAIGTFTDVYTVKYEVKMGQEVKQDDFVLQTIPESTVPENVITDISSLDGRYYRIAFKPGMPITDDLFMQDSYTGTIYERDVFLDSLPVGTKVGDYIDIRVQLPGGEEFVVFSHRRVNARYENAIKLTFDESDLWLYTSMKVDKALYGNVGFNIYATKYKDPAAHDGTVEYYPVRKEVTDIMAISPNLTDNQRAGMFNDSLRASIDAKLKFYSDKDNPDGGIINGMWQSETSRYQAAHSIYEQLIEDFGEEGQGQVTNDGSLLDPNGESSDTIKGDESLGDLNSDSPSMDGQTDASGNGNTIPEKDYIESGGDDLFSDEEPIT